MKSAIRELFKKISGSGIVKASYRFHEYRERLAIEKELILFRIIQELINNILKHSGASFIHLIHNIHGPLFFMQIHHDGMGIVQADFDRLNISNTGLCLKNITTRISLQNGKIIFEKDILQMYYKVYIEIPVNYEIQSSLSGKPDAINVS
ncbi:MAG: hypothetical protein N2747_09720 [Chitinophagaceae bacterium]|nr:hypothetical protein [Chitinophagaceae bacterium]